jgi:pimeloyl-ACP methyl ester carboxylesterase
MALELATIAAVTEALGVTRCDVLGWSFGAAVAAQWAADQPEKVSRLVLYGGWATGAAIGDEDSNTNRQLADRLGITERSAESHLERIRLRLGFRSRSQVAAWYVARDPHK